MFKPWSLEPTPTVIPLLRGDSIRVQVMGHGTAHTLRFRGMVQREDGTYTALDQNLAVLATTALQTFQIPLTGGFLLSAEVEPSDSDIVTPGELWVRLALLRGITAVGALLYTLAQGHPTRRHALCWPFGLNPEAHDEIPQDRYTAIPDPAAGSNFIYTLDTAQQEMPISIRYLFDASAAVANRFLGIRISEPGTATLFSIRHSTAVTAGQSRTLQAGLQIPGIIVDGLTQHHIYLPPIRIPPGGTIESSIGGLQAGDQLSSIRLFSHLWQL